MKIASFLFAANLLIAPQTATAQTNTPLPDNKQIFERAWRMFADGQYYAAYSSLCHYMQTREAKQQLTEEAEEMMLICRYHIQEAGTQEAIDMFLKAHPESSHYERLNLMRANLLVDEGKNDEAIRIYQEADFTNLNEQERDDATMHHAIACVNENDYTRARSLLNMLTDNSKYKDPRTYYTAYIDYVEKNYEQAISGFQQVENNTAFRRKAPVYLADCLLATGQAEKALQTITSYKDKYGQTQLADEADRIEGEALHDTRQYAQAAQLLEQYTLETESPTRTALYKLAMSCMQTQQHQKAADNFIFSTGNASDEMAQNAFLNAGVAFLQTNNKQQALMAFQQAASLTHNKAVQEEALYNYALCLHEGKSLGFGEQVSTMEQFLNLFPNSRHSQQISQYLTEVYSSTNNYQAALQSINKIKQPSATILTAKQNVLYQMGIQAFNNKQLKEATQWFTQSMQLGNHNPQTRADATYWRAETHYQLKDYTQAHNDYMDFANQGLFSVNSKSNALYNAAYCLFKQKKYAEAQPLFQTFTTTAGASPQLLSDAYNRLGDCLFANKHYAEATTAYQAAAKADPSQGDYALYQEAIITGVQGNNSGKVQLLNQLRNDYAQSSLNAQALYEQAKALNLSGDKTSAINLLQQLLNNHPMSPEAKNAQMDLGVMLNETGRTEQAIDMFKRTIQQYPNSQEAQTALLYLKDIYTRKGNISDYAAIAQQAGKPMTEQESDEMLLAAGSQAQAEKNYRQAADFFRQLYTRTRSSDTRRQAQERLLENAYSATDYNTVVQVATDILQDPTSTQEAQENALFLRGASHNATGNMQAALADWTTLSQHPQTAYGAQAAVLTADYQYQTQQYDKAENTLINFIDSGTPHKYWLARAIILLSDVYNRTGRDVEARQYLMSLRSNYNENAEINNMIQQRLGQE